jgi:hypothetical protein
MCINFCFQSVSKRDVHVSRPIGWQLAVPLSSDRSVHPRVQRHGRRLDIAAPAGVVALYDGVLRRRTPRRPQAAAPAAAGAPPAGAPPPQVTDHDCTHGATDFVNR